MFSLTWVIFRIEEKLKIFGIKDEALKTKLKNNPLNLFISKLIF